MCIIDEAVEKHESEELKKKLEALFVHLSGITDNNVYVSALETLGATPHLEECKQYLRDGGNAYVSTCGGASLDVTEYLCSIQSIRIFAYGTVPDNDVLEFYFVCRV